MESITIKSEDKKECDCNLADCTGCFFPCPECQSRKCGPVCREGRPWAYYNWELDDGTRKTEAEFLAENVETKQPLSTVKNPNKYVIKKNVITNKNIKNNTKSTHSHVEVGKKDDKIPFITTMAKSTHIVPIKSQEAISNVTTPFKIPLTIPKTVFSNDKIPIPIPRTVSNSKQTINITKAVTNNKKAIQIPRATSDNILIISDEITNKCNMNIKMVAEHKSIKTNSKRTHSQVEVGTNDGSSKVKQLNMEPIEILDDEEVTNAEPALKSKDIPEAEIPASLYKIPFKSTKPKLNIPTTNNYVITKIVAEDQNRKTNPKRTDSHVKVGRNDGLSKKVRLLNSEPLEISDDEEVTDAEPALKFKNTPVAKIPVSSFTTPIKLPFILPKTVSSNDKISIPISRTVSNNTHTTKIRGATSNNIRMPIPRAVTYNNYPIRIASPVPNNCTIQMPFTGNNNSGIITRAVFNPNITFIPNNHYFINFPRAIYNNTNNISVQQIPGIVSNNNNNIINQIQGVEQNNTNNIINQIQGVVPNNTNNIINQIQGVVSNNNFPYQFAIPTNNNIFQIPLAIPTNNIAFQYPVINTIVSNNTNNIINQIQGVVYNNNAPYQLARIVPNITIPPNVTEPKSIDRTTITTDVLTNELNSIKITRVESTKQVTLMNVDPIEISDDDEEVVNEEYDINYVIPNTVNDTTRDNRLCENTEIEYIIVSDDEVITNTVEGTTRGNRLGENMDIESIIVVDNKDVQPNTTEKKSQEIATEVVSSENVLPKFIKHLSLVNTGNKDNEDIFDADIIPIKTVSNENIEIEKKDTASTRKIVIQEDSGLVKRLKVKPTRRMKDQNIQSTTIEAASNENINFEEKNYVSKEYMRIIKKEDIPTQKIKIEPIDTSFDQINEPNTEAELNRDSINESQNVSWDARINEGINLLAERVKTEPLDTLYYQIYQPDAEFESNGGIIIDEQGAVSRENINIVVPFETPHDENIPMIVDAYSLANITTEEGERELSN